MGPATASGAEIRALAVVLHDLASLLPRTVGAEAAADPSLDALPGSELEVMRLLVRRPELTVGEVAAELGLQRPNASLAVRALVGRGLLRRARDERDGRIARLTPTARAIANRDRREAAWEAALARRLEGLPAAEAARVRRCAEPLRALADALGRPPHASDSATVTSGVP